MRGPVIGLLTSLVVHAGLVTAALVLLTRESEAPGLFIDLTARLTPEASGAGAGGAGWGNEHIASAWSPRTSSMVPRPGRRMPRADPPTAVSQGPGLGSSDVVSISPETPQVAAAAPPIAPAALATTSPDALVGSADTVHRGSESSDRPTPGADNVGGETLASVSSGTAGGGVPALGGASRGTGASGLGVGEGRGGLGEGTASGHGEAGEYAGYLATFRRRIQEALFYPLAARRRNLTGTVQLEVVIVPTGAVGRVAVHASSSHPLLDEAAVETVRRLPALPFPGGVPPRTLTVRIPVVFRLE